MYTIILPNNIYISITQDTYNNVSNTLIQNQTTITLIPVTDAVSGNNYQIVSNKIIGFTTP